MRTHRFLVVAAALAVCRPAAAQAPVEQARTLFEAGSKAYASGNYRDAIVAFKKAYQVSQRDGLLFSLGQSYRRQYFLDKVPDNLLHAISFYRKYVEVSPTGKRIGDATGALSELEPLAERLGLSTEDGMATPPPAEVSTQIMISSNAPSATASVDGAAAQPVPLFADVKPGNHTVKVTAPGYFDEEVVVGAVEGDLIPQLVPLRERPAVIQIKGDSGAEVSIDGRFVGTTPLSRPIEVDPGHRFVSIVKNGHRPLARELELTRGSEATIDADLSTTGQRTTAWGFLIGGATLLVGGVVIGVAAAVRQNDAQTILDRQQTENLTKQDAEAYDSARDDRDRFRVSAGAVGGFGIVVGLVGGALYLFDAPSLSVAPAPTRRPDGKPDSPAPESTEMDVSVLPAVGPDYVGAGAALRF